MSKTKKYPPLPKTVNAVGGPITVRQEAGELYINGTQCWGAYHEAERVIRIAGGLSPEFARKVFHHELMHAHLSDSGLAQLLTNEMTEALCDALGTARFVEQYG